MCGVNNQSIDPDLHDISFCRFYQFFLLRFRYFDDKRFSFPDLSPPVYPLVQPRLYVPVCILKGNPNLIFQAGYWLHLLPLIHLSCLRCLKCYLRQFHCVSLIVQGCYLYHNGFHCFYQHIHPLTASLVFEFYRCCVRS